MGLLKYAILGGIKGGADAYANIAKEERKEKSEIKAEKRNQDVWDIRQTRLAEIRKNETAETREYQEGVDYRKQMISSEQAALDRDFKAEEGMLSRNATKDKPLAVSSGTDVINPNTGDLIYQNNASLTGKNGAAGKSSLLKMKNGEQKTEDDVREMYAQQFVSKGIDGFEKKDANAPSYMDWRNNMVGKGYQLDSSLVLDADMTTPPTAGEIAIAKGNLNDKASAWIPFDNDSGDDEAINTEVFRMRQEKANSTPKKKKPSASASKRVAPKDGTIITSNGKRYLVTNGRPVEIK